MHCLMFWHQIHAIAKNEYHQGDSSNIDPRLIISDVPIALFCSRAHPEEKALATVTCGLLHSLFYCCHTLGHLGLNNFS